MADREASPLSDLARTVAAMSDFDPLANTVRGPNQAALDAEEVARVEAAAESRRRQAHATCERARLLSGSIAARVALDVGHAALRGDEGSVLTATGRGWPGRAWSARL